MFFDRVIDSSDRIPALNGTVQSFWNPYDLGRAPPFAAHLQRLCT